jgi:acyl-coenzyme A thioesterase 13
MVAGGVLDIPAGFVPASFSPGFLDHAGPYFLKQGASPSVVGCRICPHHLNYLDSAHGGVLATLADVALSWAIYINEAPHPNVSTVSLTTNFLSAARLGDWIDASGVIDRVGRNLAYVRGSIRCADTVVMTMSGVFKVARSV